jgi:fibronectin type III domain protein
MVVIDWACLTRGVGCPISPSMEMPPAEDAPGAPSNLAFQVNNNTVMLTWSPPAGGGAVATYVLEAGIAAGQSNIVSFATGGTATTFTATGLPNGTYFVRVRAANADGAGPASNEVTIVVGGPCVFAPSGLAGEASGNLLVLRWTSVGGAVSYIIEAGSAPGAANFGSLDTGSTTASFTTTVPNGTYYIRAYTRAACGRSGPSNEIVVTVTGGTAPPTATGRWAGTSPNGMFHDDSCATELDLNMDLVAVDGRIQGSATTRIRRVRSTCSNEFVGSVATYTVSGTAAPDGTVAMQFGTSNPPAYTVTGTVSSTRMTGRFVHNSGQGGTFSVMKQ